MVVLQNHEGIMIYIGIDPGVQWSALAIYDVAARTVRFATIRADHRREDMARALADVEAVGAVVEGQQVYVGPAAKKVDKQDIVHLAQEAGRLAGMMEGAGMGVEMPRPSTWKGGVEKPVHNARTVARMASDGVRVEWGLIPPSKRNHYIDAVALAYWLADGKVMMRTKGG